MTSTTFLRTPREGLSRAKGDLPFAIVNHGMIVILVILAVVSTIADPQFLTVTNGLNLLLQWAPVGLMAVGMTFVIIAGGFDLSVGGTFAAGCVLFAGLTNMFGVLPALAMTLAAGAGIGLVNGLIITGLQVNPFVTTLGTGFAVRGLTLVATAAAPILVTKTGFDWIGSGYVLGVPVPGILLVAALLIGGGILTFTVYGRSVFAVGGSAESARLSGVPVKLVRILTYVVTGLLAALAGMILASRLGTGQGDVGANIELQVITVVVVGGTALAGGEGAMWRTAVGIALLAVLGNSFDRLQVSPFWQLVIQGLIVVFAVAVDSYSRRHRKAPRAA